MVAAMRLIDASGAVEMSDGEDRKSWRCPWSSPRSRARAFGVLARATEITRGMPAVTVR